MNADLRLVLVGGNLESERVLRALLEADHGPRIVGVVVPGGRLTERTSDLGEVEQVAIRMGLTTHSTDTINSTRTVEWLRSVSPTHVFVTGWSQLLHQGFLSVPTGFTVGSHPSDLPYGRGRAPIPWTLLEGATNSAVSLFRMDIGVDSGPVVLKRRFGIEPGWHAADLYEHVSRILAAAFVELVGQLGDRTWTEQTQDGTMATYRAAREPEDGRLDFTRPALELERLIRAVSRPYPGAFCYLRETLVQTFEAPMIPLIQFKGVPGQVLKSCPGAILVQAADRPLWLADLFLEGQPISGTDLARHGRLTARPEPR